MEERNDMPMVPLALVESMEARHERTVKRLIASIVLIIVMFVGLVLSVIWNFDFEFAGETYSQDGQGYNVMGTENEVKYGAEVFDIQSESNAQDKR